MALDVGGLVLALAHQMVLRVDVAHRQLHHLEQLGGGGVLLSPGLVGDDLLVVHHEAVVLAVGQLGVQPFLLAGQGGEGHFQPHHVGAGLDLVADPVRRPGVVQHRLARLEAGDGVGDQRRVSTLLVRDGGAQAVGVQVVFDYRLAAPAGVAARQVGLAVAVGVKQLGDLGVLELLQVGDFVRVGRLLVDQVALRGVARINALAVELAVAARVLVVVGVQRVPVVGHEGGIAIRQRHVGRGVFHFLDGLHGVAQLLQGAADQQGLEGFLGDGALQRLHADALARLVVGLRGGADAQGHAASDQGAVEGGFLHRSISFKVGGKRVAGCWQRYRLWACGAAGAGPAPRGRSATNAAPHGAAGPWPG